MYAKNARRFFFPIDLFFPAARDETHPSLYQKVRCIWHLLESEAQQASLLLLLCGRCKTLQTWERQSRDKIWTPKSNYKRQMTLISHEVWQLLSTCKETVVVGAHNPSVSFSLSSPTPSLPLSLSATSDFQTNARGLLIGLPPSHGKWVINSVLLLRAEEACSLLCSLFGYVLLTLPPPHPFL